MQKFDLNGQTGRKERVRKKESRKKKDAQKYIRKETETEKNRKRE
jgi:hypothetical protein